MDAPPQPYLLVPSSVCSHFVCLRCDTGVSMIARSRGVIAFYLATLAFKLEPVHLTAVTASETDCLVFRISPEQRVRVFIPIEFGQER